MRCVWGACLLDQALPGAREAGDARAARLAHESGDAALVARHTVVVLVAAVRQARLSRRHMRGNYRQRL